MNNLVTVHDLDTMIQMGNDLADISELLNDAFGNLLCLEIFTSTFFSFLDLYIGVSFGLNLMQSSLKVPTFVVCFGLFFTLIGLLYLRRVKILFQKGSRLKIHLEKCWTALREITILKYPKMHERQTYELSSLSHRFYNLFSQGAIRPNDYFILESSVMTKIICLIFSLLTILLAIRSSNLVYANQLLRCNLNSTISPAE